MSYLILKNDNEHIEIRILKRSCEESQNLLDLDWLDAEITIAVTGFKAMYPAVFRADDFKLFHEQLNNLLHFNSTTARFDTLEKSIELVFNRQKLGNITCYGTATNETQNILEFTLVLEHEGLDRCLRQLNIILEQYPQLYK